MLKRIDRKILDETSRRARRAPRRRVNFNYHELPDPVQRMLNAIEPGSYVRPHRHLDPPKTEVFLLLRGRGAVVVYGDDGTESETVLLEAGGETQGVEIPPGVWHTVVSLEEGTVFFEVKDGPYVALTDKDFAPWAPKEGSDEAAAWLQALAARLL